MPFWSPERLRSEVNSRRFACSTMIAPMPATSIVHEIKAGVRQQFFQTWLANP